MLIIPIIGWFIPNWIADKPDVRYTLSEKISLSTKEDIQQLIVKNAGNIKAEKIQLKINTPVNNIEIQKFSQGDKVEQYSSDKTEIVYPELPPQGSFTVIIKTVGGISSKDLSIMHQKGAATDALSQKNVSMKDLILDIAGYIYLVLMFCWAIYAIRSFLLSRFDYEAKWYVEDFLRKKKPFYFSEEKWLILRREALERKIEIDNRFCSINEIKKGSLYKMLCEDKPIYLKEDEWLEITKKYPDMFNEVLSRNLEILNLYQPNKLLEFLQVERPKHYDAERWKILQEKLQAKYIEILKFGSYFNLEKAINELKRPKPSEIGEIYWQEYQKFVVGVVFNEFSKILVRQENPLEFLSQYTLDFLPLDERNDIVKRAFELQKEKICHTSTAEQFVRESKPDWMLEKHYVILRKKAEDILENESNKKISQYLLNLLNQIVQGKDIPDDCGGIDQEIWAKLQDYQQKFKEVNLMQKRLKEQENQMKSKNAEVSTLKDKIIKQLGIIDGLLDDPHSLTKIEVYDNPFSEGNYENLRQIAKILHDNKVLKKNA